MTNSKLLFYKISALLSLIIIGVFSCKENKSISLEENSQNIKVSKSSSTKKIYELIDGEFSGITFNNKIEHNLSSKSNLFDFDYFYNGAGVGIEDINNDGLKDIFFCGNQTKNRLYLNKGNLTFEDITDVSNINPQSKNWSNGVTFADVNSDGWIDIYVSQGGPYKKNQRKNLLLINQKNNTFLESSNHYGLDDNGISTQSVFFDFDNDNDLDCFVMNESEYYGYDPITFLKIHKNKKTLIENSSHLYENVNGKFTDISESAGLLQPSFGLGVCVTDLNQDNLLDIYIANDYYIPDAMYINTGNSFFINEIKNTTKQVSFFGMGVDIADINNDNLDDVFVLDMASQDHIRSKTLMASMNVEKFELLNQLGFQKQYMFNTLQLNIGNNKFHNISHNSGLSKTDWSWSGLIEDFDFDGLEDIYVSNGYRKYALDNDIRNEIIRAKQKYKGRVPLQDKKEIYDKLPSEKLPNILFKNNGNLKFENKTDAFGLKNPSFSNGVAYGDLDNDGDLEIVVNNIDSESFLYKNLTIENKASNFLKIIPQGELSESFVKVQIQYNGVCKTKTSKRVRGYLSSVENSIFFGLNKVKTVDTVKVYWPSGKYQEFANIKANKTIIISEKNANHFRTYSKIEKDELLEISKNLISHKHHENIFNDFKKEILLPYKQSTLGPYLANDDVNGDGLIDLYIGGAHNSPGALYLQNKDGSFKKQKNKAFETDATHEDMEAVFIDVDNDKDNDLYVVSGGNEFEVSDKFLADRLYINDGIGNFSKDKDNIFHAFRFNGKTVTKIDYDNDGDLDLIVGNRIIPQQYPKFSPSFIFQNNNGDFKNITNQVCKDLNQFGIINKIITTDINNDGWEDFIAVGEWTHIGIFINNQGIFKDISSKSNLNEEYGWWTTVKETDINNDGLKDYLIGNIGENIKYKVSKNKPLNVFANDFDDNGTLDIVLSQKYKGIDVPIRGKECSSQQMPFISEKIPTFEEFANSSLIDIYGDKINTSYNKKATNFKSILLVNQGNGNFKKNHLPELAQLLPILDTDGIDFNSDGFEDLVVVGNIYNTEVETPRLDNSYGLILISNQKNNYKVLSPLSSGLYIDGNAKSVKVMNKKNIIIGRNNDSIISYKIKKKNLKTR